MYISKLSIRNFRNFRNVSLKLGKGVNTIIGENGSGKTNLFQAIRLLIDDSLPRGSRFFESDFNRTLVQWKGNWIVIQLRFADLDSSEEAQALAMHKAGDMEEFDSTTGSYSLFFRPKEFIRKELFEYSSKSKKNPKGLQEIIGKITINDYEVSYRGRGNADFSDDKIYLKYAGDFEKIAFPDPDDEATDVYGIKLHGLSIPNEVSCTFAKALRDVENDLRSYRDNPLLNLLRGKEKSISVAKKEEISNKISILNNEISELEEVKTISSGIASSIRESVGETYAPNISVQSELPSEIEKLLQSLKLLVGDPDEPGYQGRIWEMSLGGANLIYLSLKLLEYERVKAQNRIANFLLIEEPEAHIHTHIQKSLFQKLDQRNTQVIISTHSTHISSVSQISTLNVLHRADRQALVFSPSNDLSPDEIRRIERYLDAVRTNLLFAKGVILVEGDAEQIVIPEMFRKVFGVTLDEIGVSLINIGSTGFQNVATLFHDRRINKRCSIITDLDRSIRSLPKKPDDDNEAEKHSRNSEKSGAERRTLLESFCKGNNWVKAFYANHTFEVNFLLHNNSFEVVNTVKKAFNRESDQKRISELLESEDVAVCGTEMLRLADKFGKGWFALMLSEQITHWTGVPRYILESIAFSSPHINEGTLLSMCLYRLRKLTEKPMKNDKTDYHAIISAIEKQPQKALEIYVTSLRDDTLTEFISILGK